MPFKVAVSRERSSAIYNANATYPEINDTNIAHYVTSLTASIRLIEYNLYTMHTVASFSRVPYFEFSVGEHTIISKPFNCRRSQTFHSLNKTSAGKIIFASNILIES